MTMHSPKYVTPAYKTNPLSAIAAGKTGEPETFAYAGGADASASKIVFTGNHIAGDTVTVGGVVFTAVASGAAAYQWNVGVDLSTSITNLITALDAAKAAKPTVAAFTFTKTDTNTALTATPVALSGDLGNTTTADFGSTHSTVVVTRQTNGKANYAVSLDTETSIFNNATGGNAILAAGDEGQDKNLVNIGAGSVVVYCTIQGGTKITIPQNKAAILTWLGSMWRVDLNDGGTIA
jgi:hypothetical protein